MTTWTEFAAQAPDVAAASRTRLMAFRHHVVGTLRRDGSPRLSGTEVSWHGDELVLGFMPGSRKAADLARDPRLSLHSNPGEGTLDPAAPDVRISGRGIALAGERLREVTATFPEAVRDAEVFAIDLREVMLVTVAGELLQIACWRPGLGLVRHHRR